MRPDHLGDVLLASAPLAALRAGYPGSEIVALVGPWAAPIVARSASVDRVVTYPFPWFDRAPLPTPPVRFAAAAALATRLRPFGFGRAYILRPDHWWGALALALAGIEQRVGFETAECRPLLTEAVRHDPFEHVVRGGLRLVAGDGPAAAARPGTPPIVFPLAPLERAAGAQRLAAAGLASPRAIVHPGASGAAKRWPPERWAAVTEHLNSRGFSVGLVAGPDERRELDSIAGRAPSAVILEPPADVVGLAGLVAGADLALGLDSLAMHLATAVGTPSLALYGPGDEAIFGPWGDPICHRAVRAPGSRPDPDWFSRRDEPHPTMAALDVGHVLAAIDDWLGRPT